MKNKKSPEIVISKGGLDQQELQILINLLLSAQVKVSESPKMINLAKVQAFARDYANLLQFRLANSGSGRLNTVVTDKDASGNPVLVLTRGGNVSA